MTKNFALFAIATAAICATACNKASDKPDDKAGVTHTTSAEVETTASSNPLPVEPTKDDYFSTVRREQLTLRTRLDDEMASINRQLGDLHRSGVKDSAATQALVLRRQTLAADANIVDRADERGWDELKATVQHDLEEP